MLYPTQLASAKVVLHLSSSIQLWKNQSSSLMDLSKLLWENGRELIYPHICASCNPRRKGGMILYFSKGKTDLGKKRTLSSFHLTSHSTILTDVLEVKHYLLKLYNFFLGWVGIIISWNSSESRPRMELLLHKQRSCGINSKGYRAGLCKSYNFPVLHGIPKHNTE